MTGIRFSVTFACMQKDLFNQEITKPNGKAAKTTGSLIFNGPSLIDGKPIIVIAIAAVERRQPAPLSCTSRDQKEAVAQLAAITPVSILVKCGIY